MKNFVFKPESLEKFSIKLCISDFSFKKNKNLASLIRIPKDLINKQEFCFLVQIPGILIPEFHFFARFLRKCNSKARMLLLAKKNFFFWCRRSKKV